MVKIHIFDVDKLRRRASDRHKPNLATKNAPNDPKMAPQNAPKTTKNRCPKMIEILIEKKALPPIHLGRPGGMRWPPGGIIGGSKNYPAGLKFCILKICRFIFAYYGFTMWKFGIWLGHLAGDLTRSAPPLRGGRRIASPKGEHRRPPVPCVLHLGVEVFCFHRSLRYLQH